MSASALVTRLVSAAGELELARGERIPLARPASEEEAVELVRLAARERLRILPLGLGSKLGWCRPPRRADFALTTSALAGIVAYEPGDGTVTARAGTRMSELAAVVRAGGHRTTPDVPCPQDATLGGVLAAGQSGPDRLRFGPMRHHVLGTRVLLANGEITRSGGRLVKNVTGYDLHRLYCGSHGTLGLILDASLRLFPLPEAAARAHASFAGFEEALVAASALLAAEPKPTSVALARASDGARGLWTLRVLLEGRGEVVEWERSVLSQLLPSASWLVDGEAWERAARDRDEAPGARPALSLHATSRASRIGAVASVLLGALDSRGLRGHVHVQPGVASLDAALDGLTPAALPSFARELRAALAPLAARVSLRGVDWSAPALAGEGVALDPFGDATGALPLMHRLRARLDPQGLFASGRFHGGL